VCSSDLAPVVVVQDSPPVYVVEPQEASESAAPVYVVQEEPAYYEPEPVGASFNFHVMGLNESDTDLAFETIQGADLFGLGGALRLDVDSHWMVELGLDILASEEDGVEQITMPLTLSLMAHLFPDSTIDPYGVAGVGVIFNEVHDPSYGIDQYSQLEGHLGAGVEINLGEIVVTTDLRFLTMGARPNRDLFDDTFDNSGRPTIQEDDDAEDPLLQNTDPDQWSSAVQFMVGAGWRF
jgi:hypothetical protein